jgi:hypothetical protein
VPDLTFKVTGVEPSTRALVPMLEFQLQLTNTRDDERIHTILLRAQIQFQCPQRSYTPAEKEKLVELFGPPDIWGQSLRNRLWTQAHATVCAFQGRANSVLQVACTFDLNIASTKYIYALDQGEVSLLFLFTGTVFYEAGDELKVEPISWDKECIYSMPVGVWRELMDRQYPNIGWVTLHRDVLDRLYAFKRSGAFLNWEQTMDALLQSVDSRPVEADAQLKEAVA